MASSLKAEPVIRQSTDASSVDAVVKALYESVSFAPGGQPDYHRLRTLFHRDARITPPTEPTDPNHIVLDVDSFILRSREYLILTGSDRKGFYERETHRITETIGEIAHVFSTYESRYSATDAKPIQRGINSVQLINDARRWSVVSIIWDVERTGKALPTKYLP